MSDMNVRPPEERRAAQVPVYGTWVFGRHLLACPGALNLGWEWVLTREKRELRSRTQRRLRDLPRGKKRKVKTRTLENRKDAAPQTMLTVYQSATRPVAWHWSFGQIAACI